MCSNKARIAKYRINPQKHRDDVREWQQSHKEVVAKRLHRWYENNKQEVKARNREWRENNRDKYRAINRNRRSIKKLAEGSHNELDIKRIRTLQDDRCAYCKIKLCGGGEVDHIKALVKGGSNWPSNLQLLCTKCNRSKGPKDQITFMRLNGRLL